MHDECSTYVARQVLGRQLSPHSVLDVGGMNVNGTVRHVAPTALWTTLDIKQGPGVDIVADAATWKPDSTYDLVLCLEVLEHAERWEWIVQTLAQATRPGGHCLITCASDPRPPHGAYGDHDVPAGEHYENVDPDDLLLIMKSWFEILDFTYLDRGDTQILARRAYRRLLRRLERASQRSLADTGPLPWSRFS